MMPRDKISGLNDLVSISSGGRPVVPDKSLSQPISAVESISACVLFMYDSRRV